jgi:hypothetical protein
MANLRSHYVYVIGATQNPVKIGLAANLKVRMSCLQVGCPDPLVVHYSARVQSDLAPLIEAAAHQHFADAHRHGEWFNVAAEEAAREVARIAQEYSDANGAMAAEAWRPDRPACGYLPDRCGS